MTNTVEIRALVVTPDPWLLSNFTSLCDELGIAAQRSATIDGVPDELGQANTKQYSWISTPFQRRRPSWVGCGRVEEIETHWYPRAVSKLIVGYPGGC